jgi:hypothetical protein
MDLAALGRSALLVPTPGQTEQEYLAEYLSGKGYVTCVQQGNLTHVLVKDYMGRKGGQINLPFFESSLYIPTVNGLNEKYCQHG